MWATFSDQAPPGWDNEHREEQQACPSHSANSEALRHLLVEAYQNDGFSIKSSEELTGGKRGYLSVPNLAGEHNFSMPVRGNEQMRVWQDASKPCPFRKSGIGAGERQRRSPHRKTIAGAMLRE